MTSYFDMSDAEGMRLSAEDDDEQCKSCRSWCRWLDLRGYCINCTTDNDLVECIHGHDLFAHCDECEAIKLSAADGGEGDDMPNDYTEANSEFKAPLRDYHPMALVSMRNEIDEELKRRHADLKRELQATEHALNGTKPRKTRSDANKPRAPKAANDVPRNGDGVAV